MLKLYFGTKFLCYELTDFLISLFDLRINLIENTSKMTFREKKDISCKNNIGNIRNLETNFIKMNSHNNTIEQLNN